MLLEKPGVMQISEWVVRVAIYPRGAPPEVPPVLVLQFDLQPPYPVSKIPSISVVTGAPFVTEDAKSYLLQWLSAQAESKLGKCFVSSLVGLASMWAEIQQEAETARLEAYEEKQRRKQAKLEREQMRLEEEAQLIAEADAKAAQRRADAEARMLAGEPPLEEEEEEQEQSSSEDSAQKERRGVKQAPSFAITNGNIPPLRNLCIKSFGDNLLLFEGFEEVPIQIRAKVIKKKKKKSSH